MGTRPLRPKRQVDERIAVETVLGSRCTLPGRSFGPPPRKEVISKEVQDPLTPLHRLERFKKIRDRNLKREQQQKALLSSSRKRQKTGKRSVTMETKGTNSSGSGGTTVVNKNGGDTVTGKPTLVSAAMKKQLVDTVPIENGEKVENGSVSEEESTKEGQHQQQTRRSLRKTKPSPVAEEKNSVELAEDSMRLVLDDSITEQESGDAPEKTPSSVKKNKAEDKQQQEEEEEEEEEEIEVDAKEEEEPAREKTPEFKVLRRSIRIEEHLNNSAPVRSTRETVKASSSLSAYRRPRESYLGRVSGRRPVRPPVTPFRKRKADEQFNNAETAKRRPSPSVASPGWSYLPALNKLWAPRDDDDDLLMTSTPYRSSSSMSESRISESMLVNYDDKTVHEFHDTDLDMDTAIGTPTSSSKWSYCNLM